jgi:phosphatidylglycerophosphatase A
MPSQIESPKPNTDILRPPPPSFLTKIIASALFSGYSPLASGTVGSFVGLAIYAIPGFEQATILLATSVVVFIVGIRTATVMENYYGHDPAQVTIDEVLGMWLSLALLPKSVLVALVGFFVFRILDILKPFPAKRFDRMTGGFGIMMDDVIVAVYTNLILHLLFSLPLFIQFI